MTTDNTKYNTLVNRLREVKPVPSDADLLTHDIMQAISRQNNNIPQQILIWMRPIMTAAAVFLLGLFFYQQVETTNTTQVYTASKYVNQAVLKKMNCNAETTIRMTENRKLLNQYICYMKSNQAENENSKQLYLKYVSIDQETVAQ